MIGIVGIVALLALLAVHHGQTLVEAAYRRHDLVERPRLAEHLPGAVAQALARPVQALVGGRRHDLHRARDQADLLAGRGGFQPGLGTEDAQRALYEADPRIPAWSTLAEEVSSDPITAGFVASAQSGVPMPS